jgi:hypothetical protein
VRTPSSEQVRQPIYDKSIGQWRRSERHIDELLTVLAPLRERYAAFEGGPFPGGPFPGGPFPGGPFPGGR